MKLFWVAGVALVFSSAAKANSLSCTGDVLNVGFQNSSGTKIQAAFPLSISIAPSEAKNKYKVTIKIEAPKDASVQSQAPKDLIGETTSGDLSCTNPEPYSWFCIRFEKINDKIIPVETFKAERHISSGFTMNIDQSKPDAAPKLSKAYWDNVTVTYGSKKIQDTWPGKFLVKVREGTFAPILQPTYVIKAKDKSGTKAAQCKSEFEKDAGAESTEKAEAEAEGKTL